MKKPIWRLGVGVGAGIATYALLIRPWHLRWGATPEEAARELPGDEYAGTPRVRATHAITINAPVSEVWKWLVQIGQDKGGFYSYAWLENLVGCQLNNADRILPEYQHLAVGDSVRLHPQAPPLPVLRVEPEKLLVLGSNMNVAGTWGFYLSPVGESATRLLIRNGGEWPCGPAWEVARVLFELAHFIMERKMLLGIKARAERDAAVR